MNTSVEYHSDFACYLALIQLSQHHLDAVVSYKSYD